ncbi:hypothetical protein LCGC14_1328340 [marine sediment metagenome]|uniref:Uncharacterized protein n=1 Tax=marine sediment metagenome TaxID=412755 RepID=A0A0F9KHY5_9ZZZZ
MFQTRPTIVVSHCEYDPIYPPYIPWGGNTTGDCTMNKLQPIPSSEQATLKTTIKGGVASVTFSVKPNGEKGTPRYNLTQIFDFSNVSEAELIALAVKPLRIDVQSVWRSAKDKMDADVWQDRKWSVRAMLDQTRQKADPVLKAFKLAEGMTKAEREEYIKKLQAM